MLPKIGGQAKKAEERTALSQAPRVWVSGQVLAQGLEKGPEEAAPTVRCSWLWTGEAAVPASEPRAACMAPLRLDVP